MTPCLWTGMFAEYPLHEALQVMAECGWRAFEVSTEHLDQLMQSPHIDDDLTSCTSVLQDRELLLPQAHGYLSADVAHPDAETQRTEMDHVVRHIEISSLLGVKTLVLHPGGRHMEGVERTKIFEANTQPFRELGDVAAKYGMTIAVENMMWEPFKMPADMLELMGKIDHPSIKLVLDTSHANVVGIDAGKYAVAIGSYLVATHISDNDGSGDQHKIPGDGTIDWDNLMKGLRSVKFDGMFNLEIPGERLKKIPLREAKTSHALDVTRALIEER